MFRDWFADAMADAGLSQADIVRRTGRTSAAVSRWVSGEDIPSPVSCRLIARAFSRPVTEVYRAAGHEDAAAGADLPAREEDALTLLQRGIGLLVRERSTSGPISDGQSSGTLSSTLLLRREAGALASSPAALLALLARRGTTMPEGDYLILTIDGDWLLPAVANGAEIRLLPAGREQPGNRVIVMLGERMVTGRIRQDGDALMLAVDGGAVVPLTGLTVLAVIRSRLIDEDVNDASP